MRSKKKLQVAKKYTNKEFTFGEELIITIIDQLGPIIGGSLTLAAAWMERQTLREEREYEAQKEKANGSESK